MLTYLQIKMDSTLLVPVQNNEEGCSNIGTPVDIRNDIDIPDIVNTIKSLENDYLLEKERLTQIDDIDAGPELSEHVANNIETSSKDYCANFESSIKLSVNDSDQQHIVDIDKDLMYNSEIPSVSAEIFQIDPVKSSINVNNLVQQNVLNNEVTDTCDENVKCTLDVPLTNVEITEIEPVKCNSINENSETDSNVNTENFPVEEFSTKREREKDLPVFRNLHKRRKRIIITESNSDRDSSNEQNSYPDATVENSALDSECSMSDEDEISSLAEEYDESLPPEKPKPKCKKRSTLIKKQMEIKRLLESAIIIPVPPVKCNISKAVISSSDENEEENNKRKKKTEAVLLRCYKRKILESSSSSHETESDSNILITEPIPDTTCENYDITDEPISAIVLPADVIPKDSDSEIDNNVNKSGESNEELNNVEKSNSRNSNVFEYNSTANSESDSLPNDLYFGDNKQGNDDCIKESQRERDSHKINSKDKESDTECSGKMPNAVYFGDIQMPLNVLYSYQDENSINHASAISSSDNDSYSENEIKHQINRNNNKSSQSKSRGAPSSRSELEKLKACIRAANIKIKYSRLFEGCVNDSQRSEAIRDILEDHGLSGEPTIAKCRRLGKIMKVKREIAQLDTTAIIESSGRTLRSAGITHKSDSIQDEYGKELLTKTLNHIRNLVDTDSD